VCGDSLAGVINEAVEIRAETGEVLYHLPVSGRKVGDAASRSCRRGPCAAVVLIAHHGYANTMSRTYAYLATLVGVVCAYFIVRLLYFLDLRTRTV
jgi:hypothetical protein